MTLSILLLAQPLNRQSNADSLSLGIGWLKYFDSAFSTINRVEWPALVLFCFFPGFLLVYRDWPICINWNSDLALTCLSLSSGVELSEHWNVNETTTQTSKLTLTKQHWVMSIRPSRTSPDYL